jgi:hypothetical protein
MATKWHPSYAPAAPAPLPDFSESNRERVKAVLSICRRQGPKTARQDVKPARSWSETPEPFKRLVARAAGLSQDVVGKVDRDLSETEKALIRLAAARLKERADALFAL